jgi:uncharacterized membrane protein (DUF2068 family)
MTKTVAVAEPHFGMLRAIALYKLVKVLLLLATAYEVVRLHDASILAQIYNWMATLPSGMERDVVRIALAKFSGLSHAELRALRAGTLVYATIFAVEGIGLWMRRRWAEWLTIVVTGSLIPLEFWEFWLRPDLSKTALIVVNVAIVWYLVIRVRNEHRADAAGVGRGS